ncbi:MAG TPA: Holliday junction branch migration DNA helicase RuvB [Candidatus Paceibacterota bacterium]|jgi:Holliday junction DNA helicase RuvB|nr:Holliday junction branch migration DNA helicase RuvB [Candidatus Paceibacterota bacterium]
MSRPTPDEQFSDTLLRPGNFQDYIGQEQIKKSLSILIGAAKSRGHVPEHVLFYGPPGLGKTTLAHVIAKEMGAQVKLTSGPAIERVGDLAAILTNLQPGDMLFIDEIHRLNKAIEEVLYPVMETGKMDIMIGKGPSARTVQLDLPPFTLVGATTRFGMLSAPLRSRFSGGTYRLEFYTDEEIERILGRSAQLLDITLPEPAHKAIASRSRSTPRIANYLLRRVRDYAQMHNKDIDESSIAEAFSLLGLDQNGLSNQDIILLKTIRDKFNNGPVGVKNLAAATGEDDGTIEDVTEPYLIQLGLIERTPRGRQLTQKGKEYLNGF